MTIPHLFEFMDLHWLAGSLRVTLREILECVNSYPFRPYNRWIVDEVIRTAREGKYKSIVELAAGTAPLGRLLANDARSRGLRVIVCDGNPDIPTYQALENAHPGTISAKCTPLDFPKPQQWDAKTLLILSGAFHHIPRHMRSAVLASLVSSADRILIFEPLRKALLSFLLPLGGVVVGVLLPVWSMRRPGRFRRLLWCWVIPVAPVLFCWDGFVSCLRQWTENDWQVELEKLSGLHLSLGAHEIKNWTFCQKIDLSRQARLE